MPDALPVSTAMRFSNLVNAVISAAFLVPQGGCGGQDIALSRLPSVNSEDPPSPATRLQGAADGLGHWLAQTACDEVCLVTAWAERARMPTPVAVSR